MFQILSYSGLGAKAKAMSGKLITPEQYEQLIGCTTVGDALSLLKQLPGYRLTLADFDELSSHRGSIEARLTNSLYQDFTRLYRFAALKQRSFLDLYFMHFEVNYLKECLRSAFAGSDTVNSDPCFRDFFAKHSKLDFDALAACTDINQFIRALDGTIFHAPLERIQKSSFNSLFDYETGLDQFYFTFLWKKKDKLLNTKELEVITENYGQKIDLLNIQWIMRAKRYYHMSSGELYAMIIPCSYKLKTRDITAMAEAAHFEELSAVVAATYYGSRYKAQTDEIQSIEETYLTVLGHIYRLSERRHPYSIAPVNTYLYNKEQEISRITSIIEGIRYGLSRRELAAYIYQTK